MKKLKVIKQIDINRIKRNNLENDSLSIIALKRTNSKLATQVLKLGRELEVSESILEDLLCHDLKEAYRRLMVIKKSTIRNKAMINCIVARPHFDHAIDTAKMLMEAGITDKTLIQTIYAGSSFGYQRHQMIPIAKKMQDIGMTDYIYVHAVLLSIASENRFELAKVAQRYGIKDSTDLDKVLTSSSPRKAATICKELLSERKEEEQENQILKKLI